MSELIILGIHPHAIEMAEIVERINQVAQTWNLVGFVSGNGDMIGEKLLGLPILELHDAMERHPEAYLVPEYDWPHKSDIPRHRLATLIDPNAIISRTAEIGLGCVIYPNCFIGAHVKIGNFLFCLSGSIINHNDTIGDNVTLTSGVVLAGDVQVESGCYLGQSCTVRELLTIGRGSLIGMGAVVLHNVPQNSVMVGNPALRLRSRELNSPGVNFLRTVRQIMRKGIHTIRGQELTPKASHTESIGQARS